MKEKKGIKKGRWVPFMHYDICMECGTQTVYGLNEDPSTIACRGCGKLLSEVGKFWIRKYKKRGEKGE